MAPLRSVVPGSNFLPDGEIGIVTQQCECKWRASCTNFEPRPPSPSQYECDRSRSGQLAARSSHSARYDGCVRTRAGKSAHLPVRPYCPAPRTKIFLFFRIANQSIGLPSRPTQGGVAQRQQRGAGMRWTRMAQLTRAPDADGEVVWS